MCTVVVRIDPGEQWPVTMLALRDESPERPWDAPGAWWPDRDPTVRGVRDRSAGGAWLAASDRGGLGVVLNRWEPVPPRPDGTWTTRGVLPLDAVIDGVEPEPRSGVPSTRAFNLLRVAPDGGVTVTAWDGSAVARHRLAPGVHMLTHGAPDDDSVARIAAWLPTFRQQPPVSPPESGPLDEIARLDAGAPDAWTPWFATLVASTADGPHAPTSLLRDNEGPEGRFATLSIVAAAVQPGRVVLQHARLATPGRIDGAVILGHA